MSRSSVPLASLGPSRRLVRRVAIVIAAISVLLAGAPTAPVALAQDDGGGAAIVDIGPWWQNWSWDTVATPSANGLIVDFDRQWAGLQFAAPDSPFDPSTLTVDIDGQSELMVRCGATDAGIEATRIFTVSGGSTHQVDMSPCPSNTTLLAFQIASPSWDSLRFRSGSVCLASGECIALLDPPLVSFTCASDGGNLSWSDEGASKYWVYKSTDGGSTYSWLGRTIGSPAPTSFVDAGAAVGVKYQVHYQGIPRVECSITSEPSGGPGPFTCASDGGALTWSDHGASKYWVYRSTDGGSTYSWIGRTIGSPAPTSFTDSGAQSGARYQVHYQGLPRLECSITSEPGGPGPFACASDGGALSWSDHGAVKYWVYRSTDGGATFNWIGRTIGNPAPTAFTDAAAQQGARYQVHYQGLPRVECSIVSEPGGGVLNEAENVQLILDNPTRNTLYDDNPFYDVPMNQIQVSDLTVNADLYDEGLLDTTNSGYFRVKCDVSHFAYDDPIIFPNQPGRAHLHMFFGNTEANAYSTFDSLMNTGTGTCNGEDLNRTAYWVPALLDNTGHALIPFEVMVYYKNDNFRLNGANELVEPFPDNLRMVVGNAMATQPQTTLSGGPGSTPLVQFACGPAYNSDYQPLIPDCYGLGQGAYGDNGRALEMRISFPQCYDPDAGTYVPGGAHMSYSEGGYYGAACPDSHPYDISSIMYRIFFSPDDYGGSLTDLRLSSDVKPNGQIVAGGTTAHADWFGAWNADAMDLWVQNCNNTQADCEIGLLDRDPMISLVPRKRFGYETGYRAPPWELLELCPEKDYDAGDPLRSVANCKTS